MTHVPTVKIKSTHPASQGAFVEINESDYDPAKHGELYVAPPPAAPVPVDPPVVPDPDAGKDPFAVLAALGDNWSEAHGAKIKSIAAAMSGRTPANKDEAIALIKEALAAKAAASVVPPPPA